MTFPVRISRHCSPADFTQHFNFLAERLLNSKPVNRNEWQGEVSLDPQLMTYELQNVILEYHPTSVTHIEASVTGADMPWAEDHFQERVSGKPLNPPPSAEKWPWHTAAKDKHKMGGQFSHTYPERFWPKEAGHFDENHELIGDSTCWYPHQGIRFQYGDLGDLVEQLRQRPFSRQAYLPVFFPEDTGAPLFQRVPCTLGYHFIRNGMNLDCNYFIRSCDMTRHFRNDVYFTVRLLQWMQEKVQDESGFPMIGKMTMFISNLHIFEGDRWRYQK